MSKVNATARPIVELLSYQRQMVSSPARFTWANWSRQIGKSFAFALRRVLRAVQAGRLQVLLSAGERQSRELMDKVRQHVQALQIASEFHDETFFEGTSIKQLELRLPNGGRIIALPANPNTARGFTGDVFLDEFAMHRYDREIWAALLPTVMRGNGQLDVASTPKGKNNQFYRLADNAQFDRSTVTIHDAVKAGLDVAIADLRAAIDDEQIWQQEFECAFLDESSAFLTFEQIIGCEDEHLGEPLQVSGDDPRELAAAAAAIAELSPAGECFVGVDVGRKRDLTVLWLLERVGAVLTTRLVVELLNCRFRSQYELLSMLLRKPFVRRSGIDATGIGAQIAETATEDFGESRVDGVVFTQAIKELMAGRLKTKVEDTSVRVPATQRIRNDWHAIERRITTGGRIIFHADRSKDGHADRFWAAALAVSAAHDAVAAWDGTASVVATPSVWSREWGVVRGDERRAMLSAM